MNPQPHTASTQPSASPPTSGRFMLPVSLRVKLLVGFSIIFSLVFAGAFYWFYTFATEKTISRLRDDMRSTLVGAAAGVDVDEMLSLYAEGEPNTAGFSDDPRYLQQLAWFETVHSIEPRAWLYSYVIENAENFGQPGVANNTLAKPRIVYMVDLWANYDPSKAAKFREIDALGRIAPQILQEGKLVEEATIYSDRWGTWLSAFAPLYDSNGRIVAVLGLDIEADYVAQVQQAIRSRVLVSFIITYGTLFVLIYVLSGVLTQHLAELTKTAERIGAGRYDLEPNLAYTSRLPDEMHTLAQVFESMVYSIRMREQMVKESKRTEYEMRLALQEERELNELKSRFVSMVSHELRTPLTVIRTSIELLERYGDLASEDKKQEYFGRGRAAIQTMNQLLEDVLMIGKAEAGKLEFKPVLLDLQQFCREVIEEMSLGSGSSHEIHLNCTGNRQGVCFDPNLLRSILTNLLSNAIKYSAVGSVIDFTMSFQEQGVEFEICDRGIGIPPEDQARLFELFHRASNAGTIRGTGLGLAIVKQCVAQHQGQVTFTSQEGVGTTFIVKLPTYCQQSGSYELENAQ